MAGIRALVRAATTRTTPSYDSASHRRDSMTFPNHRPTRRRLLQVGGIAALGLTLPRLLHGQASVTGSPAGQHSPERSCIFIVQYGGCSHIDSFDPRPDAPDDVRGPYRPIPTRVP